MSKTMSKEELDIMQEKLTKALSDKAFAEKVLAMETPEEVRAALLEKDIDLDVDDLIEIKDLLDEKGALHLDKAGLIAYSHGLYHQLGKVTGFFGWSVARPEVLEKRMKEYR